MRFEVRNFRAEALKLAKRTLQKIWAFMLENHFLQCEIIVPTVG